MDPNLSIFAAKFEGDPHSKYPPKNWLRKFTVYTNCMQESTNLSQLRPKSFLTHRFGGSERISSRQLSIGRALTSTMAAKFHAYPLFLFIFLIVKGLDGASPTDSRSFVFTPKINMQPQLVLIAGCTGTGFRFAVSHQLLTMVLIKSFYTICR